MISMKLMISAGIHCTEITEVQVISCIEKVKEPAAPPEVAARINQDNVPASRPASWDSPLIHEEALHGAQWGMATMFPQPIGMASSFDDELVQK
ncbi:MAG: hypothetical protein ACLUOI_22540 [Eisenbergiella sp.]